MKHSILIPHRNRHRQLALCLGSLMRSAAECECDAGSVEIIVADADSNPPLTAAGMVRVVLVPPEGPIFNKCGVLNAGLDAARGDYVTVLDADAVVGPRFLDGITPLELDPALTRVAYRVCYLKPDDSQRLLDEKAPLVRHAMLAAWRGLWNIPRYFRVGWEAYRFPDRNRFEPGHQPWGNSQFTMRREDLDGLRYDESMPGHGWEDIDFNRQVYERFRGRFRGVIWTDAEHAMFHLRMLEKERDWDTAAIRQANLARYKAKWPVPCEKEDLLREPV